MNIYEFFDTEEDRENYVAMESAELAHDRIMLALDLANKSEQLAIREAEIKCIMESGDTLDLMEYYEDAEADAGEKKQNLLQKAWQALKNLLKKIKNFFSGKKIPAEGETEAPADIKENHNKIKQFWNDVKGFVAHPVQSVLDAKSGNWDKLAAGLGAIAAVSLATVGTVKLVKYKNSDLKAIDEQEGSMLNEAESAVGKFADTTIGKIASTLSTKAHDFVKTVIEAIKNLRTTISNFIHGRKGDEEPGTQLAVVPETKPANREKKETGVRNAGDNSNPPPSGNSGSNGMQDTEKNEGFRAKQLEGRDLIKKWKRDKEAGQFKSDEEAAKARKEIVDKYKAYGIESVDDLDIPGDLFEEDVDPFGFEDIFNLDDYTEAATDEDLEEILAFF
jgi:hypothetical protein